jgi:uncharacterized protein involved in response to NO
MMSTPASAPADRSLLRVTRKAGDFSRDGRGRVASMPPILQYGFRPFFFLAAVHAGGSIPIWLWLFFTGEALLGPFHGLHWHAHEMLFGYLGAVIAGFILTAIPNWTGRLPLAGRPLAILVALWLAGRLACAFVSDPLAAIAIDLAFPEVLAFVVWREVAAGRNWKNAPVALMITLLGLANAADHAASAGLLPHDFGQRLALGVAAMLIALIGGRIVPSFTRNWLVKSGEPALPSPFGRLDKVTLATMALAALLWIINLDTTMTGAALLVAGALLVSRLARWRGHRTFREPMLLVLHAGYAWLAVALMLLGAGDLTTVIPPDAALHALTAGAIGTMTLAVMTRASLGHTGREITADRATMAIYLAVTLGAALRVAAPFAGDWYEHVLACGGALWSAAFLLFVIRYARVLFGARVTG